jgi:hypothetical protein
LKRGKTFRFSYTKVFENALFEDEGNPTDTNQSLDNLEEAIVCKYFEPVCHPVLDEKLANS